MDNSTVTSGKQKWDLGGTIDANFTDDSVKNSINSQSKGQCVLERRYSSTDSVVSRGNWGSKWEFLLSCVGLSVGIGNVWRFPYLAYENGGGAFLLPYLIMLFLAGKPMYFMELAFGQYSGKSPLAIWCCAPIAKGVGFGMLAVSLIVVIYYNVIMAYSVFYMASTFQSVLPWTTCDQDWAIGTNCTERRSNLDINETTEGMTPMTPSQVYWEKYVLNTTDSLSEIGGIKWDLCLCLLFGWIIVALCLFKGIKTSGKVVYFVSTFPYAVLITLLVCGLMQEGSIDGVLYFITPTWEKLLDIQVWQRAAGQMFYSLSISMGALISYSSYNGFRNNIFRDAMIVSILDTLTSIIAGLVIFSVLGAMAYDLGVTVPEVVASGFGLAFVVYPEALAPLPIPQLWAFLFFLMFFLLGLASEFSLFEGLMTSFSDEFPVLRKYKRTFCIVGSVCCFLLGLPCVTRGGQFVLEIMNDYGGGIAIVFVAVFECIAIGWIYGTDRFRNDIKTMLGFRPSWYWKLTWTLTSPIVLAFVFIYSLLTHEPIHERLPGYPPWANLVGWLLASVPMIQVPLWAIIMVLRQKGPSLKQKLQQAMVPSEEWGPNDPDLKETTKENKIKLNGYADNGVDNYTFTIHL